VVRLGRVTHIGPDQIDLEHGSIPTDSGQVHVDCSASGLRAKLTRYDERAAERAPADMLRWLHRP
jgi:hypothetical protein